jgi:type I restriction enzyme S subunit
MPETNKGVVPRLRFPEFRDAGPWEVKRLGKLFKERTERGGEDLELLSVTISDGVVRASELERKNNASADLSNYKRVQPGDIVYNSMRMWQGASGVSHWHGLVSPAYTVVTPVDNQNPVFWSYHFKLSHSVDKFARFSQGLTSDTWNLKYPAFSAIKMAFPPDPAEQQKIADCLSSLDEVIELEAKRLDALKAHKKGLLQQLFPREGETTPRLRFPEFRDAGPWEVKRLGDKRIAKFVRERVSPERIPLGHYVSTVNLLPDFAGLSPAPEPPPPNSAVAYRKGDILMSNIRPYLKKIWIADRSGGASNDVLVVRPGENTVGGFLGQILMSDRFVAHVMDGAKGVKMPRGDLKQIQDFEVPLPQKAEQQKIADCLSSLDELIELQAQKLDALKAHKKGLLQQLFPQEVA